MNDWLPHQGGFRKECPECEGVFIGRKNKIYCSDPCKARHNNDLAALKKAAENRNTASLLKNIEILTEAMTYCTGERITVPMDTVLSKGFDPHAPNTRVSRGDDTWFRFGDHVIRVNENNGTIDIEKITNDE